MRIGLDEQNLQRKTGNIFLPISFNICFGCSKDLRNKKINYTLLTEGLRAYHVLINKSRLWVFQESTSFAKIKPSQKISNLQ